MTRRQRNEVVEAHADLILADKPSLEAYAAYFETQVHRGRVRRLLYASYRWLVPMARRFGDGAILTGFDQSDIQ